jgi:hypothetical protein
MSEGITGSVRATCVTKKDYNEMRVEIEPVALPWYSSHSSADRQKYLEQWADELHEFIRDHRSMDVNSVHVVVPEINVCSECGGAWEPMELDGQVVCACCGVEV